MHPKEHVESSSGPSQTGTTQALTERLKEVSPPPRFIPWPAASAPVNDRQSLVSLRGILPSVSLTQRTRGFEGKDCGRRLDIWAWAQFALTFGLFSLLGTQVT